jgi:hypothetical protein
VSEDVQAEREALLLVEDLFTKSLAKPQVVQSIRDSKTISERVRRGSV